ncbi:MAG: AAA family ATPase [Verrucomicrobiae bacterium]|nr:AAA family ATPase [Verrucomicrobiae bacterium]
MIQRVYLQYYKLREPPFNVTPDPRFLFFSRQHQEAFNHLLYGIRERKGFIQLTGEVGTGKTTVCRRILEELGPECKTALILNPLLSPTQMLRAIAHELGIVCRRADRLSVLQALNDYVLEQANCGCDVVLLFDEAQDLSPELLEMIRLLSNLETDTRKLLQIGLIGQPELREKLAAPSLRQLRQRIAVHYHLGPLSCDETAEYINRRLTIAGADSLPIFDDAAVRRIYQYSGGVPRLINAVCDRTLLAGFVKEKTLLTEDLVELAIRELQGEHQ